MNLVDELNDEYRKAFDALPSFEGKLGCLMFWGAELEYLITTGERWPLVLPQGNA